MRVAGIDCGTNSVRLLVIEGNGAEPVELRRELRMVRLGQGVDATGEFHPDALARTFAAVDEYAAMLSELGVERVRFAATSAARDVSNRAEFAAGIRDRLGVEPEILAGTTEAELSYRAAVAAVGPIGEPVLVTDVGGGSSELVVGADGTMLSARSLDVGAVRLRERFLTDDPPTPAQVAEATAAVDALLDAVDLGPVRGWIGVAGTITSIMAVHQGLTEYDRTRIHGAWIGLGALHEITSWMARATVAELMALGPINPKRCEVIGGGALIVDRIAARLAVDELVVSEADILDGLARSLLTDGDYSAGLLN
ncbi:Ppx/GppA phosphatase family protein [Enemella sp. A6]|uniref:Ppx/GppA phosphatase family protein n=1 Tax=Enemella sp. A6 TaxID=3440152 RepID=UPI003EBC426C